VARVNGAGLALAGFARPAHATPTTGQFQQEYLPGIADAGVGERLLTAAETGRADDVAELPGLRCADREADLAGAFDL
ncbi:MAG TPA: hypothetical protein VIV12_20745, partial [Streptosporangiaceae bacterium]